MGCDLLPHFPKEQEKAREILGYDVLSFLERASKETLQQTEYTQPLLFLTSALLFQAYSQSHPLPDFFLGHSLGEYTACYAASVFTFEEALTLVKKRAELMKSASDKVSGGLIAVLGLDRSELDSLLGQAPTPAYLANVNEERQFVIATHREGLALLPQFFQEKKVKCRVLPVSAPFHSPYMQEAGEAFARILSQAPFREPKRPLISNSTGEIAATAQAVRHNLFQQLDHPVLWHKSLVTLKRARVSEFVELGPGGVLAKMSRRFSRDWNIVSLATQAELLTFPEELKP